MRQLFAAFVLACCVNLAAHADDAARARQNFQLNCMGCHGEDGRGLEGHVPSLHGTLSRIASVPKGRDYVLRVPGVTQSLLSPGEVAEVLNWAILQFSDEKAAKQIRPFTAAEVASAREKSLLEISTPRAEALRASR
ncbi:MAG TPA: c-type cytochrome [Steroidobacteraceae bacterium]